MRPTFGDTRPTFGNPLPAVRDGREPERPSIGVQLGMDGTELPALSEYHAHPFWLEAHDFEPAPDGLCNVCGQRC